MLLTRWAGQNKSVTWLSLLNKIALELEHQRGVLKPGAQQGEGKVSLPNRGS